MAKVIIGIHGLGNKPSFDLLEHWWRLAMTEGLKYGKLNPVMPRFELVYWADILYNRPLNAEERNPNSPYYLDEPYTESTEDFRPEDTETRKNIVDYLRKQMDRIFLNEDLTLNYSFIPDIIIKRYFRDLDAYYSAASSGDDTMDEGVRERIRKRLLDKLRSHSDDDIMLICHSMGSIVAYDVLTLLAPEIEIDTLVTIGSPLGFPFVIGRIASEQKISGITDGGVKTPPGITGRWYNFSDITDKVAFNYKLADHYAENAAGIKPVDMLVVNDYVLNGERNPHKSYGYLRTPELSGVISDFIISKRDTVRGKLFRLLSLLRKKMLSLIVPAEK